MRYGNKSLPTLSSRHVEWMLEGNGTRLTVDLPPWGQFIPLSKLPLLRKFKMAAKNSGKGYAKPVTTKIRLHCRLTQALCTNFVASLPPVGPKSTTFINVKFLCLRRLLEQLMPTTFL